MFEKIFGKSWATTVGGIMTVIGLIPSAIQEFDLADTAEWLNKVGLGCSTISFLYLSFMSKSKTVTGVGDAAVTKSEVEKGEVSK